MHIFILIFKSLKEVRVNMYSKYAKEQYTERLLKNAWTSINHPLDNYSFESNCSGWLINERYNEIRPVTYKINNVGNRVSMKETLLAAKPTLYLIEEIIPASEAKKIPEFAHIDFGGVDDVMLAIIQNFDGREFPVIFLGHRKITHLN
ncbi:hypothetical protein [Mucilaginibacter sp. UR6-11]|uniref:hypothetical protein n=1 Tax=Mucilaginibacter sp. UR6-11 TaxID=1435644 RepID=UPI001E3AC112|nr:hypothetical protein [Mucilaginibacter sp. UR6-11]MCC8424104.1 hypothetical protein [Mucilaginibacter sp. UR6-11]